MKNRLAKIFLRGPGQWWFWLVMALLVKGGLLLFQFSHADHGAYKGLTGSVGGDTELYILPVDNLIDTGSYAPDYRMPGYGIFYFFLRFYFAKVTAFNMLIFIQYIMAAISVYALALTALRIFKWPAMFYITYYLFLISTYSNLEDGALLTESFTVSFLIFTVYFLVKWAGGYKSIYLILSGLLATEVIFLKPVFAPLLLLFVLFTAAHAWKAKKPVFLKYAIIFMVPFMLIDGAWAVRNYSVHKRILPLATVTYLIDKNTRLFWSALYFMQAWGGNYISWDPNSEMRYFNIKEHITAYHKELMKDTYKSFPSDIYTSAFNADSLTVLKNMVGVLEADTDKAIAQQHTNAAVAKFDAYTLSIKNEKPFVYYVKAPLRITKIFLIHPGTYNLFPKASNQLNKFELAVKIFYSLFYVAALLIGFIGIMLIAGKSFSFGPEMLVSGIIVYTVIIYPIVLRLCEARYFMPAWPFLLVCVAYCMYIVWQKMLTKKK